MNERRHLPLTRYFVLLLLMLSSCSRRDERYESSLIDDLSGVWVYPAEQLGETTITVVDKNRWRSFHYDPTRIDTKSETSGSDSGEILGEEGVYFLANRVSFNCPSFFHRASNGTAFMILSRSGHDQFMRTGTLAVQIWIRVADTFDPAHPPTRPSIEVLGLPYKNIFAPKSK